MSVNHPDSPIHSTTGSVAQCVHQYYRKSEFHGDLVRSSYGGRYSLAGLLKRLEEPATNALAETVRLDNNEAPQRELDRIATQGEADRVNREKARVANKPRFQP